MRKLNSGKYTIQPTVRSVLVQLWDFLETQKDSAGKTWVDVHGDYYLNVIKPIVEKMRKAELLTADEVRAIVAWRGPLGTIRADPDGGAAYHNFIKQFVSLGLSNRVQERIQEAKAVQS